MASKNIITNIVVLTTQKINRASFPLLNEFYFASFNRIRLIGQFSSVAKYFTKRANIPLPATIPNVKRLAVLPLQLKRQVFCGWMIRFICKQNKNSFIYFQIFENITNKMDIKAMAAFYTHLLLTSD